MTYDLEHLEGKKFCVVFVKELDNKNNKVQLRCLHGRAEVERNTLKVHCGGDHPFVVPNIALRNILENDGTEILKDCEYYAMVKVDKNIDLK